MTAIKVKPSQFTGTSKVFSREPDALAAIIRGLAIDNARLKTEVSGVHDLTDNSAGTANSTAGLLVAQPLPVLAIDATSAGGANETALAASLVKIANAGKVIIGTINEASALLGLPASSAATGTVATADTIPAQDLTSTAASGTSAAEFHSSVAAFKVVSANLAALVYGANAVLTAVGAATINANALGAQPISVALVALPALSAVAAGPGALAKTDADAFLAASANNIATLAAAWDAAFNQGSPGAGALHVVAG
jgi:hypothetical protein